MKTLFTAVLEGAGWRLGKAMATTAIVVVLVLVLGASRQRARGSPMT